MPDAHYQTFRNNAVLHLWIPEHDPREQDPHYHIFHAAKRKLKELDVPCWRCDVHYADLGAVSEKNPLGAKQLEAHHDKVEFSLANAIDIDRFKADHPEFDITDEDSFLAYVESEGNLLQLCDVCHRSPTEGIHMVPYPLWTPYRIWKKGLPSLINPQAGSTPKE